MTDFSKMSRAELRAYLKANDPQPDHWLKRANQLLEARLEANRIANGWPAVTTAATLPETQQRPPAPRPALPVVERALPPASTVIHGVADAARYQDEL